jgi:diacylglycerol kinase
VIFMQGSERNHSLKLSVLIRSFRYAARGVALMLRRPRNVWMAALVALFIAGAGFWLGISRAEWCLVVLAYAAVWMAETFNTALEMLADSMTRDFHPLIRDAKDAAAGAVLIAVVGAVIVALFVFGPYVLRLVKSCL